mmetsp:Transcript_31983/g.39228  ORF Transcript_31983/g.39228 Transcript_31983/m.39228 type:complete len:130 (+) Transcript_31983:804-1193(+)
MQIVAKQQANGRLSGARSMDTDQPLDSLVWGDGSKQKMRGNAMGDPRKQIPLATASRQGFMTSTTSAQQPKAPSRPHPSVQHSGQMELTQPSSGQQSNGQISSSSSSPSSDIFRLVLGLGLQCCKTKTS